MKDIVDFIIEASNNNPNYQSLGEEIRALQDTLFTLYIQTGEPLYEFLFALIQLTPNDYELGEKMKRIKDKIDNYNDY